MKVSWENHLGGLFIAMLNYQRVCGMSSALDGSLNIAILCNSNET
jgi:hypothetical protein